MVWSVWGSGKGWGVCGVGSVSTSGRSGSGFVESIVFVYWMFVTDLSLYLAFMCSLRLTQNDSISVDESGLACLRSLSCLHLPTVCTCW